MAILQVNDIHVYYGSIHAVKGVSFEVNQGGDRHADRRQRGGQVHGAQYGVRAAAPGQRQRRLSTARI